MGPVFGRKGGATGGGKSTVQPAESINLHFTGDFHAITSAHNLLASVLDNQLFNQQTRLTPGSLLWKRVLDVNDRALRRIRTSTGSATERAAGFDITAASEVMAILCLSESLMDLRARLDRIVTGFTPEGEPVLAKEARITGALLALLRDALQPNLVQSVEGVPAFLHGGPFANIAHGCSSLLATKIGLSLSDYLITEAGFGFDLGGGWTAIIGTWWDVNDNAPTTIGSSIQEIDVWGGFSYAVDDWKFTLLYQSWNYAEQIEHIVDFKIAYSDGVLNPFLLLHGRVADEISFDTGLVTQLGIGPSKSFGKLTLGLPISVAFDTDNFHGGDAGFSFASAGVSATYAMTKNISANIGVTFYHTNDSVIPVNPDSDFFTGTAGITIAF